MHRNAWQFVMYNNFKWNALILTYTFRGMFNNVSNINQTHPSFLHVSKHQKRSQYILIVIKLQTQICFWDKSVKWNLCLSFLYVDPMRKWRYKVTIDKRTYYLFLNLTIHKLLLLKKLKKVYCFVSFFNCFQWNNIS